MKVFNFIRYCIPALILCGCAKDGDSSLKNAFIKYSYSPNIVGEEIEFAYGMAALDGKLKDMTVNASIAGSYLTRIDPNSRHTADDGTDVLVKVAGDSYTDGTTTNIEFTVDTVAATLRYYYHIPEEAKGKNVSFRFSCTSTTGESVSYSTPEYYITKMDMEREIVLTDDAKCFFSLEDMKAYTRSDVETMNLSAKIDFIYVYRPEIGVAPSFMNHSFVALSDEAGLMDMNLPDGWTKNRTKLDKRRDVNDGQLKGTPPNVYIDEPDLQEQTFHNAADNAIDLAKDYGAFIETADGKYKGYIYVNNVDNDNKSITISVKRLAM